MMDERGRENGERGAAKDGGGGVMDSGRNEPKERKKMGDNKGTEFGISIASGLLGTLAKSSNTRIEKVEEIYGSVKQQLSPAEFEIFFRIMCMDIKRYHPILYSVFFR